jgi:hypothetical protein
MTQHDIVYHVISSCGLLLAFDTVKVMIAWEVLLTYLDPNEPFNIETDASDYYQLGAVIKQHSRPAVFFSHKLTGSHHHYTMIHK